MTLKVTAKEDIKRELQRARDIARIPVQLPSGKEITLSPGGQNPLIKAFIEDFCTRFVPGGVVLYVGDAENKFQFFETEYFARLGVQIDSAAKMPDVVIHDPRREWLVIGEAVTSAGVVDGKLVELHDKLRQVIQTRTSEARALYEAAVAEFQMIDGQKVRYVSLLESQDDERKSDEVALVTEFLGYYDTLRKRNKVNRQLEHATASNTNQQRA